MSQSNPSSGKMGFAIARAAVKAGHKVTLISANTLLQKPKNVKVIEVGELHFFASPGSFGLTCFSFRPKLRTTPFFWICTSRGFLLLKIRSSGFGAESVSRVTTQAVVLSSITVLLWDYLLTAMLL